LLPSLPTQSLIVRSFLEGNRSNYPCLEGEKSEKRQKMYKSMAFWSKTSTTRITIGQKKKSEHQETNVGQFLISRKGRFLISTQPMRCDLAPPELSQPPTCRLLPPPAASCPSPSPPPSAIRLLLPPGLLASCLPSTPWESRTFTFSSSAGILNLGRW